MPIPKPRKNESKEKFMDRCLSNPTMNEEYDNDQKYAICLSQWQNKNKKSFRENEMSNKQSNEIERRFFSTKDNGSEIRLLRSEGQPLKIVGYFAKFDKMSRNLGWFFETIERGFFRDALEKSDTADLFNHDANIILGRVSSGTLRVWEDETGLAYECTPPDTQLVRDMVIAPIERGDVRGCSFGFKVKRRGDDWDEDEEGRLIRTLKEGGCSELFDGSQVVFPAYPDTDCALRSMEEWRSNKKKEQDKEQDDLKEKAEKELRDKKQKEQDSENNDSFYDVEIQRRKLELKIKSLDL